MWRNRRAFAAGNLLRASFGSKTFFNAFRKAAHPLGALVITSCAVATSVIAPFAHASVSGTLLFSTAILLSVWTTVLIMLTLRGRSLLGGIQLIATWHYFGICTLLGLLMPIRSPLADIPATELTAVAKHSNLANLPYD
jgi:hypothetical protein